ncbi:MAG TPA: MmcQ/YjbR family DNA-binding protein [Segetibacter sp.]|jgi:predicted DNA-binding protein (MmcQ/YjbR family)|nr:MmcQ/YjbR family DNA-binding protein [Segetibacter sp.]
MDIEQLRDYCLTKPEAEECFPFGPETLVYKVNGKIFLLASIDKQPLQFNVKCDPEKAIDLREQYSSVLPGYHMNKKLWNTVIIDGTLSSDLLKEFVDDSYTLVIKGKKK